MLSRSVREKRACWVPTDLSVLWPELTDPTAIEQAQLYFLACLVRAVHPTEIVPTTSLKIQFFVENGAYNSLCRR